MQKIFRGMYELKLSWKLLAEWGGEMLNPPPPHTQNKKKNHVGHGHFLEQYCSSFMLREAITSFIIPTPSRNTEDALFVTL